MPLTAPLLLLADSRLPAGGHAHSGGMEAATVAGLVGDEHSLEGFLRGRLATAGLASAGLAAAACAHAAEVARGAPACWAELDAEAAARTPSPAQRAAARVQGRALLRAARAAWPHPVLDSMAAGTARAADPAAERQAAGGPAAGGLSAPYHPVVLGACAWITGGTPGDAALIAATGAITGPASAAIRLLGLDPLTVTGLLARLGPETAAVAAKAAAAAAAEQSWTGATDPGSTGTGSTGTGSTGTGSTGTGSTGTGSTGTGSTGQDGSTGTGSTGTGSTGTGSTWPAASGAGARWAGLPAPASPGLDLLAERHAREEVALFES